jgi:hypothetical protein
MTDTPIGDQAQTGQDAPPAPAPVEDVPAPAPEPRRATATSSPTLVKELDRTPPRYGFVIGVRDVDYDVPGPPDAAGNPTTEHVHFAELQVAWFDGHTGGCSEERVEAVQVAQG